MAEVNDVQILVVDDSAATREVLRRNLEGAGYRVFEAASVAEALDVLDTRVLDLVLTDVKMPRVSGLDLVRHVRENLVDTEITVITGFPSIDGAVQAIKHGAVDYLPKPFTDEELLETVRRAVERVSMRRARRTAPEASRAPAGLLGASPVMEQVFDQIARAARTRATVLITGESGTGKELVARAIHYSSSRASAPFVPIHCAAIPTELLESELFGHVKGAFTGASTSRAGFFLTADSGTIFLDEISETSLATQVKLLRVLQEREVVMVGADRPTLVDVRIIAATNKDLATMVDRGGFRQDLFYRLNVLTIEVPPLRARPEDVALLSDHFVKRFATELGRPPPSFTERALDAMRAHSWPGNVRELENMVQRLVVMNDASDFDAPDLPQLMRYTVPQHPDALRRSLAEVEADHVARVLDSVDGNKTRAAEILGIDRKTLRSKLAGRPPRGSDST